MTGHQGSVESTIKNQVSWITFAHPQHNSMPGYQLDLLTARILFEGQNPESKIIVLQSAGDRTFCAGANFGELMNIRNLEEGKHFFSGFAKVILAMRDCGKIIIGRVQGKAVGGGLGLLAATDYCMATKWALVRLSELSLGIGPFVIEPAISRKVGKAAFSQLALNPSEWQSASWARDKGLYQEYFDHVDQLDQYLVRYLDTMTSYHSLALSEMKKMLWQGTEDWPSLLESRAEKSATLLLEDSTQALLRSQIK